MTDAVEIDRESGRSECTIMECSGTAEFAYWMPDFGQFARAREPEHDLLDDGDLSPYVCERCRHRMAAKPHWDADRFERPEEKLIADGGQRGESANQTGGGEWVGRGTWLIDRQSAYKTIGVVTDVLEKQRGTGTRLKVRWRPNVCENVSVLLALERLRSGVWEVDHGE